MNRAGLSHRDPVHRAQLLGGAGGAGGGSSYASRTPSPFSLNAADSAGSNTPYRSSGLRSASPFDNYSKATGAGSRDRYADYAATRTAEDLESQNEGELEGLSAKVKLLREVTVNIGNEVRDSTKLMNSMNDSFDSAGGLLKSTFKRMNKMARRQGGQWCYFMMFILLCLVIFFWTWVFRH